MSNHPIEINPARSSTLKSEHLAEPNVDDVLLDRALLTLPINKIEPYERNPRRQENPNYAKIKESIAKDGLNQPLVVTRRPNQGHFVIYKGGNTRLKAMTELYDESGDYRFRFIDCCFIPWSGFESDAIIGHLQENEMRKSLCFIDKAHGIQSAIELLKLEATTNEEHSIRKFHSKLTEKGFSVTLSSLSIMLYAAEVIEPHLSSNVCVTMGRPQMQKLRKLQKAFVCVCQEFDQPKHNADQMFSHLLQDYIETEWDFKIFRRSLESSLAKQVTACLQDVALRLDGYMNLSAAPLNYSFEKVQPGLEKAAQQHKSQFASTNHVPTSGGTKVKPQVHKPGVQPSAKPSFNSVNSGTVSSANYQTVRKAKSRHQSITKSVSLPKKTEIQMKLETLRKTAFSAATEIGRQHKLLTNPDTKQKIIIETGDWGLGYMITDYPPATERLNPSETGTRDVLWWLLTEFCDLQWATQCARPTIAKLVHGTDLIHFVKSGSQKTMIEYAKGKMKCAVPHIGLVSFCLRQLDADSWANLRQLTDAYRTMHHTANDNNLDLFDTPSKGGPQLWQSIKNLN